ncbi:RNA polymerase sigma factor [Larkinella sp. GY13]|uniref:RNA polymerase sigma factor n=1 Tax=Larkinella sp. GY13 TaxID=3453720 RepID=UPI003EEE7C82
MIPFPDEQQLWHRFRTGDEEAFAMLFKRYYRKFVHYGLKFTANEQLVEDAIQDLIIHLWLHRTTLNDTPSPTYYLFKAFRNQLFKTLKPYSGQEELTEYMTDSLFDVSAEDNLIDEEFARLTQTRVGSMLDKLPPRQKEVIYLRYFQGLRPEEIASLLNIRPQSVSNILQRALASLREVWLLFLFLSLLAGI